MYRCSSIWRRAAASFRRSAAAGGPGRRRGRRLGRPGLLEDGAGGLVRGELGRADLGVDPLGEVGLGQLAGPHPGDERRAGGRLLIGRVHLDRGGVQLLGLVQPVHTHGPHGLREELVAVQLHLRAGERQGAVRLEHGRRVLVRRVPPLVEHQAEEEVVELRGGQRLGQRQRDRLGVDEPVDRQGHGAGQRLGDLAHHQRGAVGAERGQLGRVRLAHLVAEPPLLRLDHRHVQGGLHAGEERGPLGRNGQVLLQAHHRAAGEGGQAVQVVRVELQPERHGEEVHVGQVQPVAQREAVGLGHLLVRALPVAEVQHHLVPAAVRGEGRNGLLDAALEVGRARAVLDLGERRRGLQHVGGVRRLEVAGERPGGGRGVERPHADAVLGRQAGGQRGDDVLGLLEGPAGLAGGRVHQHQHVARPRGGRGDGGLDLPGEQHLAVARLVRQHGQFAEPRGDQFVDRPAAVRPGQRSGRSGGIGAGAEVAEDGRTDGREGREHPQQRW
ncbi:hypothetical protein FTUN_3256 [Frigoriglobus tundricola]|uniref:Uncharacterized protein n=1 Tax=Frigoriglobus tundricola TaxID=2774151 RepID=A0A6M5YRV0_9BACT|nr:hypothetical protein FTUN_3256 [Frigoriglobus tundricola]